MSNEYAEAVGVWEHTIGKITHSIEPKEEDNYFFVKAKSEAEKASDGSILTRKMGGLYYDMVIRSKPELNEETEEMAKKREWLKTWIGVNINQIVEDFLVAFNWTTPEKLNELKKKVEKEESQ